MLRARGPPRDDMPFRRALPLFVLALVVTRLWHVACLADVFFYGEELEKGAAAKALLDGLDVPRHQLAYHYYEGGGFLISHLNALAFRVCGESLLALKLVSLAWSVAILVTGWRFVARHLSEAGANVFALLFVLAPEAFQKLSLLDLGIHFEALLFVTIVLDRTLRIVSADGPRRRDFVVLGLATGLGTWFSYQLAPVALFALLVLALRRPRALVSVDAVLGLGATAVGAAPLLWMWTRVGDAIFDIHGGALIGGSDGSIWQRSTATLGAFVASTFGAEVRHLWAPIGLPLVLAAAVFIGLIGLVGPVRGRPLLGSAHGAWLVLVGFLLFDLVVYVASGFAVGAVEHYFVLNRVSLLWWGACVVIAPVLGALWTRGPALGAPGGVARAVVGALAACGLVATVAIGLDGRPSRPLENLGIVARTKGYAYPQYLAKIWSHLDGSEEVKLRVLGGFDEPDARELRAALGMQLYDAARPFDELVALFRTVDPEHVDDYVAGLGPWLAFRYGLDPNARLAHLLELPSAFHGPLVEASARFGRALQITREHLLAEARSAWPAEHAARAARGFGERLADWARLDPDRAARLLSEVDPSRREMLSDGYRAALRARRLDRR